MGVALSNNSLVQTGTGALDRFPGTEYFTSLDASTEVKCGNSYMQDDRFTLPNGVPPALSKGDFWMSEASGSPELYFYGDGPGAPMISHNATSFLGDVTGTIASNTVEKIQGLDVLDAAPNDGDVLTWDDGNSRWAPIAPAGGTPYYTVLDATATHGDINTALTNYDVVYLEPGNYGNVTASVTLPINKQLIGLNGGGDQSSSTRCPIITMDVGVGAQIVMGANTLISGIRFVFGGSSTPATPFITAATANGNSYLQNSSFYSSAGIDSYAIAGSFKSIRHVTIQGSAGITLNATTSVYGGENEISYVYWAGNAASTSVNMIGLNSAADRTYVHDCVFSTGTRGIYLNAVSDSRFENIWFYNMGSAYASPTYCLYDSSSTRCSFSNLYAYWQSKSGTVAKHGFYFSGAYTTADNIYAYTSTGIGIDFTTTSYNTVNNAYAYDCGSNTITGTWYGINFHNSSTMTISNIGAYGSDDTTAYGIRINAISDSAVTGVVANGNAATGVFVNICTGVSFSAITSNSNGGSGISVTGNTNCTFGGTTANSNTVDGVNVGASQNGLHFDGGTSILNGGTGFNAGNSGVTNVCRLSDWHAKSNSTAQITLGTNWEDYSTPMSDPGGENSNDLLQWSGSAWVAKGGTSGDRLSTLYGSAMDLAGHLTFTADNTYDIGASGATRPRTGYFGASVIIAGQTAMKAADSASGDLSGTYPGPAVAKVQGYSMTSGAPARGDSWQFDGTNWIHARNYPISKAVGSSSGTSNFDILTWTPAAVELSNTNSLMHVYVEIDNPSGDTCQIEVLHGGRQVHATGTFTYTIEFFEILFWNRPGGSVVNAACHRRGTAGNYTGLTGQTFQTDGLEGANAILVRLNKSSGSNTVYARAYINEIRKE